MSESIYECHNTCLFPIEVDEHGALASFLFERKGEGIPERQYKLVAKPGTLVPHHFRPANDQAKADRQDQISDPEKYIKTDMDLGMIAEIMVDSSIYKDEGTISKKSGRWVITKPAKVVAMNSIRETIGDAAYKAIILGEATVAEAQEKDEAIKKLLSVSTDEKEQRKHITDMLANAKLKFFRGWPLDKLAEIAYDNGLCEA